MKRLSHKAYQTMQSTLQSFIGRPPPSRSSKSRARKILVVSASPSKSVRPLITLGGKARPPIKRIPQQPGEECERTSPARKITLNGHHYHMRGVTKTTYYWLPQDQLRPTNHCYLGRQPRLSSQPNQQPAQYKPYQTPYHPDYKRSPSPNDSFIQQLNIRTQTKITDLPNTPPNNLKDEQTTILATQLMGSFKKKCEKEQSSFFVEESFNVFDEGGQSKGGREEGLNELFPSSMRQ